MPPSSVFDLPFIFLHSLILTLEVNVQVCIKNACVGYLLVLQGGDAIFYENFGPYHASSGIYARVTGRWILLSHAQNAVCWLTFHVEPRLSIPDFVLQLDNSRKESLGSRLSGLNQKVSMQRGELLCLYVHITLVCKLEMELLYNAHDNLVFKLPWPQTMTLQYETGFVCK